MNVDEHDLAVLVLNLSNRITRDRNLHLKNLEITSRQADILHFLESRTATTITDLKYFLKVSHQTAQGIVKRMSDKELVTLSRSSIDKRVQIVTLTNLGTQTLSLIHLQGENTGSILLKGMSSKQQLQGLNFLKEAYKNISNRESEEKLQ